jgi:hypothetical protein
VAEQNERDNIISIDSDALNERIRGDFGDPNPDSPTIVQQDKEPDVVVAQDVQPQAQERTVESPSEPVRDERLAAALSTIENLKREQENIRGEIARSRQPQRFEPGIEMMDTPLGIPIPKNPQQRFVQLTPDQVQAVGLDPAATEPLNILANVFYASISNTLPGVSVAAMQEINRRENDAAVRFNSFFGRFPDLRDHSELVEAVERSAREREGVHMRFSGNEYGTQIARRARYAISRMRGVTLDDYERGLTQPPQRNGQFSGPRAVSARGGKHRPSSQTEQQREMDI